MTRLTCHLDRETIPPTPVDGTIPVWLYGPSPPYPHAGTVGSKVLDLATRFRVQPSAAAMDFLSIAMAVTAADTFVKREDAPDGWSRTFEIELPLAEPDRWQPHRQALEAALRFLSSDRWRFTFQAGGARPPALNVIRRRYRVCDLSGSDCVALFSGGLDSAIGALDLLAAGHRPLLVSHAPGGDAKRQRAVAALLPSGFQRVTANTYPTWSGADDDSMRTRSLQFIALGVLTGQAMAAFGNMPSVKLFVCENGLIALNPPLTPRRLGSHSTRTAHPYFLGQIGTLLHAVGLPIEIINPYEYATKGEMIRPHASPAFVALAAETVSCGKWKRQRQQCGRCVPCLIRRSSLFTAGVEDRTSYQYPDLHAVMHDEEGRDDLIAIQTALIRLRDHDIRPWVLQSGPLPIDAPIRDQYFDVARRGMDELAAYLRAQGFRL